MQHARIFHKNGKLNDFFALHFELKSQEKVIVENYRTRLLAISFDFAAQSCKLYFLIFSNIRQWFLIMNIVSVVYIVVSHFPLLSLEKLLRHPKKVSTPSAAQNLLAVFFIAHSAQHFLMWINKVVKNQRTMMMRHRSERECDQNIEDEALNAEQAPKWRMKMRKI